LADVLYPLIVGGPPCEETDAECSSNHKERKEHITEGGGSYFAFFAFFVVTHLLGWS
jgi:hypothetical protein